MPRRSVRPARPSRCAGRPRCAVSPRGRAPCSRGPPYERTVRGEVGEPRAGAAGATQPDLLRCPASPVLGAGQTRLNHRRGAVPAGATRSTAQRPPQRSDLRVGRHRASRQRDDRHPAGNATAGPAVRRASRGCTADPPPRSGWAAAPATPRRPHTLPSRRRSRRDRTATARDGTSRRPRRCRTSRPRRERSTLRRRAPSTALDRP